MEEYESADPFARSAEFIQDYRDDEIRRRKLKEEDGDLSLVTDLERGGRDLQGGSDEVLEVVMRRCSFEVRAVSSFGAICSFCSLLISHIFVFISLRFSPLIGYSTSREKAWGRIWYHFCEITRS